MAPALPFIAAGLGAYSSIKGAQQQGEALDVQKQQYAEQERIRNMILGRLTSGPSGAVGNPFSAAYGSITPPGGLPPVVKRDPRSGDGSAIGDLLAQVYAKAGR